MAAIISGFIDCHAQFNELNQEHVRLSQNETDLKYKQQLQNGQLQTIPCIFADSQVSPLLLFPSQ